MNKSVFVLSSKYEYVLWALLTSLFMLTPIFSKAQQYKQLTDVPTVYIETENNQSIISKEDYINCTVIYVDGGEVTTYPNTQIRGRGNSSWWNSPKKAYRIKFEKKQRLLGDAFANAKSWTLLANHGDKTLIRNALTYDLGKFIGMPFCPAARFVDLYLNGQYRGSYQISDHVQVGKNRVDIDADNGWFLEVTNNNAKEDPYFSTSRGIMYNLKNPEDEFLTTSTRIEIAQYMQRFEIALFSDNFQDVTEGYRAYVDEKDLVNWYVASEITGNIDALYSIYQYKDINGDKFHFGPLWDLDMGYDNSSERSLLRDMEGFLGLSDRPYEKYIQRMWEDPWFAQSCNNRLNELIDQGLESYLLNHIDSLRNAVYQSQYENFKIWRINEKVYDWEKHVYHTSYDAYIDDLKEFIRVHIPYLKEQFAKIAPTAGIENVRTQQAEDEALYDLQGREIGKYSRLLKGIYILKGKKIIR